MSDPIRFLHLSDSHAWKGGRAVGIVNRNAGDIDRYMNLYQIRAFKEVADSGATSGPPEKLSR